MKHSDETTEGSMRALMTTQTVIPYLFLDTFMSMRKFCVILYHYLSEYRPWLQRRSHARYGCRIRSMNRILKVITLFPRDELETWKVTGGSKAASFANMLHLKLD